MLTYQAVIGLAHSGSQRLLLSLYPYYRPPYDERSRQDRDGPGHPEDIRLCSWDNQRTSVVWLNIQNPQDAL